MVNCSRAQALAAISSLQRLSEAFVERRQQLAALVGLSEQQWAVLEEVASDHFMPSMFAKRRESSRAAVSKILRQLLQKGLISVGVSQSDGRQRHYELTSAGKRAMARVREAREQAISAIWLSFATEQLAAFTSFAEHLAERLESYRERVATHLQVAVEQPGSTARPAHASERGAAEPGEPARSGATGALRE